jgi:hypothetical protein
LRYSSKAAIYGLEVSGGKRTVVPELAEGLTLDGRTALTNYRAA